LLWRSQTLKRIITEDTLTIEAKGVDTRSEKNRLHIVIAANADWVVPASLDERRFAFFKTSEINKQNRTYFDPLYREIADGGIAAMMFDLMQIELKGWHPRDDVPQTDALLEQKNRSLPALDDWWLGLLSDGLLPQASERNPRRAASRALFEHARETVPRLKLTSDGELGRALSERGCRQVRVDAARGWEFPMLAECRRAWAARIPTKWDDEERDWIQM